MLLLQLEHNFMSHDIHFEIYNHCNSRSYIMKIS